MNKLITTMGLVCAALVFAALPVTAQQLRGTVIDAQTKKPVKGANISYKRNKGTFTNGNGTFRIPCMEDVQITISYIGYKTTAKTITNCSEELNIKLEPFAYSLQKITVESDSYSNEPISVSTLDRADLNEQSGLRLKSSLNTLPGIEMQTRSPWGGQRITIRGYYPNAGKSANFNGLGYQLYYNNVPVTDAAGTTIMDDIDFSNLGNVVVIKGPSPLYGNAIAGTVKLQSQRPQKYGTTISEEVVGGSYGLFRNNTSVMSKSKDMDLRINYGHQLYDSFRDHDHSKKDYLSVNGNFKVSDQQRISAFFSYNRSREQLSGNLSIADYYAESTDANPDYVNNDGKVDINSFCTGITSYHRFSKNVGNKTTVFATGSKLDQNFAHGFNYYNNLNVGARTSFTYNQQMQGGGAVTGKLGAFIQKSNQSVDGVFIPPFIKAPFPPSTSPQFPSNKQNNALNYNVFTKWKLNFANGFLLSAGGILNVNKYGIRDMLNGGKLYNGSITTNKSFDPTFSPSVSLLKSFNNQGSVYASVATGNTPPLLGDIIAGDGSVNNQLSPEDAIQYEIGSKGELLDDRLSYRISLFDLVINDRLATQYKNDVEYVTNVGKQQNRGLELALGYQLINNPSAAISKLSVDASYTYSDFTYDDFKVYDVNQAGSDSLVADNSDNDVAGVAPHRINIGVDVKTSAGVYLNANYKFKDRTPLTFDNKSSVKPFNLVGARLGYEKKIANYFDLDAYVGSNNLTGSTYYNFLFVGQNGGALGDGEVAPAPYKTTVYGGLKLSVNF